MTRTEVMEIITYERFRITYIMGTDSSRVEEIWGLELLASKLKPFRFEFGHRKQFCLFHQFNRDNVIEVLRNRSEIKEDTIEALVGILETLVNDKILEILNMRF